MAAVAPTPSAPAYYFEVKMSCGGCSGAINRVLEKQVKSPNAYSVSLEKQQVFVWGPDLPPFENITDVIAKTGKTITKKEVVDEERLQALQAPQA